MFAVVGTAPGAGTPSYQQWRPPDGPVPWGTTVEEQEHTYIGNPDIRIPVFQKPAERLRQGEEETEREDVKAEEETERVGAKAEEETEWEDAKAEEETQREDVEAGERQSEGRHEERSHPEQLTHGGKFDGGQGRPETFPDDATPPRDLRRDQRRPEREKREERIISLEERDLWTNRKDL
ncbi:hypothetical protein NDU88_006830 [Pleurodeles waltl]|uniref:Uncharacterized protein n=1 Tax=Pleurodeles waltl TaxID=8319 RepID=A0AAV7PM21_PLEWA|nr:hypothetical protein NDU88_006830 [Pleurodeles waltl]